MTGLTGLTGLEFLLTSPRLSCSDAAVEIVAVDLIKNDDSRAFAALIQDNIPLLRHIADRWYQDADLLESIVVPVAIFNLAQSSLPSPVSLGLNKASNADACMYEPMFACVCLD